ncbi:hypothetical protein PFICI_14259 [Pestalotiopsis fici W106-1]|uniref:Formylmethionine deformylase-like protein n=1 Tax=Pestalotiopsis fici (strain W106-1 / CGMCC3.15140) TaxID=1229662 RepID=W3WKI9_PESFW|nr:uncharacterized protein PFICI_14259 [Pestalotiopsis fici W106-1]ETS74393.1 hypothetical protein PFICI_14259 [Pestalotiopsis fici W106-1]
MAGPEDWNRAQAFPGQESRVIYGHPTMTGVPAARLEGEDAKASANYKDLSTVSVSSVSQTGDSTNPSQRPVSRESRTWLPMQGANDSTSPSGGIHDAALISPPLESPYSPPPATHISSQMSSFASRRPMQPMEFEDSPAAYMSSGPGFGSAYASPYTPREAYHQHGRSTTETSQAYLLQTPPVTTEWTRESPTPPPYSAGLPPKQPKRWFVWRPEWIMFVFLLLGLLAAVGHHIFYKALDDRLADNQVAMLRYGTILAFVAKAGFVAATVTAFRQRLWVTVRNKILSVGALDSLFAATSDITALWNREIYHKAKIAMLLAGLVWITPLIVILTSNTLTVRLVNNIVDTKCPSVRTLNFTFEEVENFRKPTKVNGLYGLSVNLWNATTLNDSLPGWYDYYTAPHDLFRATASLGIFSKKVNAVETIAHDICGVGWNCSYTIEFVAPGYKCTEVANGVNSAVQNLGDSTPPFNTSLLLPEGQYSYFVHSTEGDYSTAQLKEVWPGGMPLNSTPSSWPEHLGAFRTEPIIWAGYSVMVNQSNPPANNTVAGWNDAFIPKIFACEHYETHYKVNFTYEGKDQSTKVLERTFLYPVMNTTYQRGVDANDGTNDNTTATPESNYVYPYPMSNVTNTRRYRRLASFHSIGLTLREVMNGTVNSASVPVPNANTKALQTKLLDPKNEWFAYPDLQTRVQSLYEDIILSMLSNHMLVSVAWAAKPWEMSGDEPGNQTTLWPCTRTRWENRYHYVLRDLWIVYSCAFACAIVAVIMGTGAVLANEGRVYDTRFSSIVAATRGPALEKMAWHEDNGSDIRKMKVGYGLIHRARPLDAVAEDEAASTGASTPRETGATTAQQRPRFGFGLEGDVRQTKRVGSFFQRT